MDNVERERLLAEAQVRSAAATNKLKRSGLYDQISAGLHFSGGVVRGCDSVFVEFIETAHELADEVGVPRYEISQRLTTAIPVANNRKLTELGEAWLRGKMNEKGLDYLGPQARSERKRSALTHHMRDTLRSWEMFVECVGNLRLAEMRPEHFRRFHAWADRESAKRPGGRWHQQLMTAIKLVFNYAQRFYPDWAWPPGISERLRSYTPKRYASPDANAEPMPPEVFQALLKQCAAWAALDPDQIDVSTQSGRGRRLQIIRRRRDGRQMSVVLRLAVNCGLNAVDFERLKWSHIKLDDRTPHLELGREKVAHSVGKAIERRIPLLPAVVDALRAWRRMEPAPDGFVFRTASGTRMPPTQLSRTVRRLLEEAGLDHRFTLRHARNIGPTLAANGGLNEEQIERFLGHALHTTSRFYKGRAPVEYLQPVVALIERAYFAAAAQ
ncbi:MAG: tyrosine-type recombinase/integrase [Planctomycetota bacterium]